MRLPLRKPKDQTLEQIESQINAIAARLRAKPIMIVQWEFPFGVLHRQVMPDTPTNRELCIALHRGGYWVAMHRGVRLNVVQ